MKKRGFKNLSLNKKSISNLENNVKGGAIKTADGCANNTGCVGPIRHTCGIVNCDLQSAACQVG